MLQIVRTVSIAAVLAALVASSSFAQPDTTKVGAINLSYVARMSKAGKAGLARIDEAARKKSLEVEAKAAELKKQQSDMQKTSVGLSARARVDLQRAFEKSRVDFDRLQQDTQKEIEAMQTQFEIEFRAQLAPVIDEALALLRDTAGTRLERMSGSGATCFALYETEADRSTAAASIRRARPGWWCLESTLA